jgi:hypothetical protein
MGTAFFRMAFDFRETEKSSVRPHEPEVEGTAENGSAGKGMPVNGGDGEHRIGEEAFEERIQLVEESLGRFEIIFLQHRYEPFQVDAVGENLFMSGRDQQRFGAGLFFNPIQHA